MCKTISLTEWRHQGYVSSTVELSLFVVIVEISSFRNMPVHVSRKEYACTYMSGKYIFTAFIFGIHHISNAHTLNTYTTRPVCWREWIS